MTLMNDLDERALALLDSIGLVERAPNGELVVPSADLAIATKCLREAVEAEREACAKMCDEGVEWHPPQQPGVRVIIQESCAKLARDIRSRSEKPE